MTSKLPPSSGNTYISTPADFANALLASTGQPDTTQNVKDIVAWEQREGGNWNNSASFNPLNTTQPEPGSSPIPNNSAGVQAYKSWNQGLQATTTTLFSSGHGYKAILNALNDGNVSVSEFAKIVGASSWETPSTGWPNPSGSAVKVEPSIYKSVSQGKGIAGVSGQQQAASSGTTLTAGPGGIGSVLLTLDNFLNPGGGGGVIGWLTGNMEQTIKQAVARGIFTIGGLVLVYLGIKQFTGGSGQGVIQIIQKQQRESRLASGQAQQGQIAAQRNATQQAAIAARSASAAQASQDRRAAIATRNEAVHHAREKEIRIAGEAPIRESRAEGQRRMAEAKVSEAQTKAAREQRMSKPRRQTKAEKTEQRIKAHKAATSRINAVTNAHKNIKPKSAAEKVADDAAKGIEL